MTTLYRLAKTKLADSAFSGEGARLFGGRWNTKGSPCVYLGGSIAICVLEALVHLSSPDELAHFTLFSLSVPDNLITELDPLPEHWNAVPQRTSVQLVGTSWLQQGESLVLLVPSAITGERNALLNPLHPQAGQVIATAQRQAFPLDPRLFKVSQ